MVPPGLSKPDPVQEETLGQSRVAAFSDGVFAVAITLLVLDLQVPKGATIVPLPELLRSELPSYIVFAVSFAIVGIKWLNHQRMFARIRRADTTLIMLNLLLLAGVTVVPFTTALLARYIPTPYAALASLVYGLMWTLNGVAYTLVLGYALRRGLTTTDRRSPAARRMFRLYALGPIGYAVGAVFSFVNVYISLVIYCVVVSAYILPPPRPERLRSVDRV